MMLDSGKLWCCLFLSVLAGGCRRPATVVRPDLGQRPISMYRAPTTAPSAGATDLAHSDQVRTLLDETREPIRLRVIAHPLAGDATTEELIGVCRSVLTLASGRTRFDANDPLESDEAAEEARILGVVPLGQHSRRRRRDPLPPDAQYRTLVVAVGREILVVPQITEERGNMEFQVAEAISRLLHGTRLVGLVTDAERGERLIKLRETLDRLDVRPVDLEEPLSPELSALLIVGPGKVLRRRAVRNLEEFLEQGKSVALLLDGMEVEPGQNRYRVQRARSGLEDLLGDYGIELQHDLVFDNHCGRVSVPARMGRMLLPYPPIPTVPVEPQEMTPDAREVRLPFPSSLRLTHAGATRITKLLQSSDDSWAITGGFDLSPFQRWEVRGRNGPHLLGVVSEPEGDRQARIAIIANSRFVEDQYLGAGDNATFLRQLVEWLGGHRALSQLIEDDHRARTPKSASSGPSEAPPDHGEAQP